jgi:hypothetical protein
MPSLVRSSDIEKYLRNRLETDGYVLINKPRRNGETGPDIIAEKPGENIHIEVISFESSPPARSLDFFQAFFRAISRIELGATRCVIATSLRFENGLPTRVNQYKTGWARIGKVFPELEIWLVDCDRKECKQTKWGEWVKK